MNQTLRDLILLAAAVAVVGASATLGHLIRGGASVQERQAVIQSWKLSD